VRREPVRLHAEVEGPDGAPAVVLGPSLGTTLAMWRPQVAALRREFRVVTYDHRGHGGSPLPPGPYALDDLAVDLLRLLDDLGLETAHLCGLSLGGMVAMRLATIVPGRVERLALLCTSARLGPATAWNERAAMVRARGTAAVADGAVERWFTPAWTAAHAAAVAEIHAMLLATPREGYAACCEAIAGMDLVGDLAGIRAPTLVVAAAEDPATPPDHARDIAERIPHSRLEVLSPAAHLVSVEQADAVTRLLSEHLRGGA
jgi:3-oxoadipate enol-lactonase